MSCVLSPFTIPFYVSEEFWPGRQDLFALFLADIGLYISQRLIVRYVHFSKREGVSFIPYVKIADFNDKDG